MINMGYGQDFIVTLSRRVDKLASICMQAHGSACILEHSGSFWTILEVVDS